MSAALLIDILLWGSVFGVGLIAFRRGPTVFKASLREGAMDFINIVPRIALGVIGSGYIAAIIPQEVITGWLGPDSGWLGVATAVIRKGRVVALTRTFRHGFPALALGELSRLRRQIATVVRWLRR